MIHYTFIMSFMVNHEMRSIVTELSSLKNFHCPVVKARIMVPFSLLIRRNISLESAQPIILNLSAQ